MNYPKRKHPRLKNYDYSWNGFYFITICTKDREPLLGKVSVSYANVEEEMPGPEQVVLSSAGRAVKACIEDIPAHYASVTVDCYVIMPDHIHILLQLNDKADGGQGSGRPTVPNIVHGLKRISAACVGQPLWQSSFYDRIVRNEEELTEIRRYITSNPVKWDIMHP